MHAQKKLSGFTIVELLIVVVVIAILATISLVAYTNIQQRATNSSITSAVSQTLKLLAAYTAANDSYPQEGAPDRCLVPAQSSCTSGAVTQTRTIGATLTANLATLGTLPSSVPDARPEYNGITYSYAASGRTVDGNPLRAVIVYSLIGSSQRCGSGVVLAGTWNAWETSTTGYSMSNSSYTTCIVAIPGP